MPIRFHSENILFTLKNKTKLKNWIAEVILKEKSSLGEIGFIFCSDKHLQKMNMDYLKHNAFTDVITFDYSMGKVISGDIFISIERVRDNSILFKKTFENELLRVMIHGVLHLLGYKDKKSKDKLLMSKKEDHYLLRLKV